MKTFLFLFGIPWPVALWLSSRVRRVSSLDLNGEWRRWAEKKTQ